MSNTSVVSVKVSQEILREVRRSKNDIDWPDELRAFIQGRLRKWRSEDLLGEIHAKHARLPPRPHGFTASLVREGRDRH